MSGLGVCKYQGQRDFDHSRVPRIGVLLVNLGTPDAPTNKALRRYLKQFLSDPRVIELPRWKWLPILNLFILPFRPAKSAALYRKIWTPEGSPLLLNSQAQVRELVARFSAESDFIFALGMRYGNPSIENALLELQAKGMEQLIVVPMFPQYSGTTTGSVFDEVTDVFRKWRWVPEIHFVSNYTDHPAYIQGLAASIKRYWQEKGAPEKLMFSFHGIPSRYQLGGDPYYCHCQKTARLVCEAVGLGEDSYSVCFQSLFGKEEWLRPYTSDKLREWAKAGVKTIDVIAPGFVADCLETLEEIAVEYGDLFLECEGPDGKSGQESASGSGRRLRYIPALNSDSKMIDCYEQLVRSVVRKEALSCPRKKVG